MTVKITKETLADGSVRWRARGVSTGKDPVSGKRTQRTLSGRTRKEVEAEVRRIGHQVDRGTYVKPWDGDVNEVIGTYLKSAAFEAQANTVLSYTNALLPVRERLGTQKARSVTRADVENLRDWMLTEGRRRGGRPGSPLGPRSVRLTLGRLSAAFDLACRDSRLAANPCRFVKLPSQARRKATTWSRDELKAFLAAASVNRLYAAWWLTSLGLRRGEVLGLRWDDIDLGRRTVTISRSRVLVDGTVIVKDTKSDKGNRTLPIPRIGDDDVVVAALRALRDLQEIEAMNAVPAYCSSGYVAADELGRPVHPDFYSDEFARLCTAAGLPRIRLHDSRHTINSLMAAAGVPRHIRAAWCGHTEDVNEDTYTHARDEDLAAAGDTIGDIFKPV